MYMFSKTIFTVLFLARTTLSSGVFRYDPEALCGSPMYFLYLDSEVQCLRACYEESECAVVQYNETDDGYCRLYRSGKTDRKVQGYVLFREETDSSCMSEITTGELSFQKIPRQESAITVECSMTHDVAVIQPYEHNEKYRFFLLEPANPQLTMQARGPRLFFSKKPEKYCTAVPVFHRANSHRLYFGKIYNATGYFFYNAYAFTDYCVSAQGECLGVQEIQEYVDEHGNFFTMSLKERI
ncbi:unnamed protein product [Cylicocyclus nassatus]|uniref:Apple domain-containing protein n=1 Tax=Cylicocyclus nassatus TaxID=53992 RepID=A0AA36DPV6_CYLNA|nr:unnamed protein product [Cylicocyclus nassatus]